MAETEQTRITRFGGNPTTYNNNSARILKGRDVMVLRPEGGIEHRMYDDGTMTRVDDRTGEYIPVPEEYDAYWRDAFEQAQTNARPNLLQRGVHWIGRGIEKAGNWLQRFEEGGTTQQAVSPEQDVMNTIDAAIGEMQTNRPGKAVQKLATMMQDPSYSMIIDMMRQEYPQIESILNTVERMVGAYKCGGKTKKKVKKGAKGCVPCKKLMRVGGKLVNVWSDCEGNIISKHQAGGWLIPKGQVGLTAQFVQEPYRKAKAATDTGSANDVHYYLNDDDNKIYMQTYTDGTGWGNGELADMNNFKNWVTTANTSGQILGKNFFVNGFNFDYRTNMGTMSKNDAQAAGIDSDQFKTSLGTRGKYEASYNPLFGESRPSEVDITQGYINSLGGMNAAVKHERQQRRKDRREQRAEHRGYNSSARLSTKDSDTSNDFNVLTTDEKQANLNNIDTNYANQASRMAAAMRAKWANYNVGTPASATTSNSGTNSKRDVLKQGGWLNKFN